MANRKCRENRAIPWPPLLRVMIIPSQGSGRGFVLVGALLILVLLVLIGISSTTSTTLELQIAGAERVRRETFYQSDAGAEVGVQLLEENLACVAEEGGFFSAIIGTITVNDPDFSENVAADPGLTPAAGAHATYPSGSGNTNLTVSRTSAAAIAPEGTALRQVTGYEHKGAGAGGGSGFYHRYNVYAQHQGIQSSESVVHVRWRHIVGLELDTCRY